MLVCSFCGKTQKQVQKLLSGMEAAHICNHCVELSHSILRTQVKNPPPDARAELSRTIKKQSPRQINAYLNQHIIGQQMAKKSVSVAIYNHFKRLFRTTRVPVQKSNMLFIGPTGVGKTLIAQNLAELLDVPFVITDATTITESGYAGDDAETLIQRLLQAADYNIDKAQMGIIYIDEIDKKAKRNDYVSLSRDVSGEGVQQSLLKLMEGCIVRTPGKPGDKEQTVNVNTKDILFIVGGAFIDLDQQVMKRIGKNRIGFNENRISNTETTNWEQYLETEDLIKYGLIPEFIGRLPSINILHELSKEDLKRVLTEPKYSIIKQYQALFELDNVTLKFDNSSISAIADKAIEQKIGARGLRRILEDLLLDTQYELPDMARKGITEVVVTEDMVKQHKSPWLNSGEETNT